MTKRLPSTAPHEHTIIAAILGGASDVLFMVEAEDFLDNQLREIFMAAKDLADSGTAVDMITVNEKLHGSIAFTSLMNLHATAASPSLRFSAVNALKRARALREAMKFSPQDYEPDIFTA